MCQKIALLVLSLVCVVAGAPKPGYLGGYHALPAATSYSSRIDIHGPEYVKTYAATPVITKTLVAAPIVKTILPDVSYHAQPLLGYNSYGYGLGHDHGYGNYGYGSYGHYY